MGHKQQWLLKVSDNGGKLAVAVAVLWAGMGAEGISGQRRRRAGGREGKKRMDSGHPNGHYILPPFSYDAPSLFSLQNGWHNGWHRYKETYRQLERLLGIVKKSIFYTSCLLCDYLSTIGYVGTP